MSSHIKKITQLIHHLPDKDFKLAEKFLKDRNFKGILELVTSDIYKIEKQSIDANEAPPYIKELEDLKTELIEYISYFDIPDDYYYDFDL